MLEWLDNNEKLVGVVFAITMLTYLGTIIAIPILVVRIPADYFKHPDPPPDSWRDRHPAIRYSVLILKNVLGLVLVAVGIVQSVPVLVPGFGLLTILIGVLLLNFPGKRRLELRIVSSRPLLKAINWIRAKNHRPPLIIPPRHTSHGG
jgi:hypothetical protein